MKIISYESLSMELEKLWNKKFHPHDITSINEHCDFIISYIEACGWTTEEYIERMMGFYKSSN